MAIEPQRLHSSFFDSCFLTGKSTQVIQFSATYFTKLVNSDAFDKRRFDRENTFYPYVFRHLTHCEAFFVTMTGDADYNTSVLLDTFFVTFFNTVSYCNSVTTLECRKFLLRSKRFVYNFN